METEQSSYYREYPVAFGQKQEIADVGQSDTANNTLCRYCFQVHPFLAKKAPGTPFLAIALFFHGDMWYQITAGEGSAYLRERAEDAHHSRDTYEAQPEPRVQYSSHAWAFSFVLNLRLAKRPI